MYRPQMRTMSAAMCSMNTEALLLNGGGHRLFMSNNVILLTLEKLSDGMEAFQLYARIEGRLPKTMRTYQQAFRDLINFCGSTDVELHKFTQGDFRRWISTRLDQGYAKSTINVRLRSIRAFFNWLARGHVLALL